MDLSGTSKNVCLKAHANSLPDFSIASIAENASTVCDAQSTLSSIYHGRSHSHFFTHTSPLTCFHTQVIPDGSPVPDTFITCSVQMTRDTKERLMLEQEQRPRDKKLPYKGCIPAAGNCGRMPPQLSKATTLQDGRAYISMVIPEAPPGMYQLKCSGKVSGPDVELQTAVSEAKAGDTAEARANDVAESVAAMTKILLQGEAMPSLASVMSSLSVGSNKAVKNSLELLSEPFQVWRQYRVTDQRHSFEWQLRVAKAVQSDGVGSRVQRETLPSDSMGSQFRVPP